MIFSITGVGARQQHAIDHVLAVDAVVDFRDSVVADIVVRETTGVAGRVRRGSLDEAAGAGDFRSRSAAKQFQADGTGRHSGGLERVDSIHHAVLRIRFWLPGNFGNVIGKGIADDGTKAFIAGEEEQFVFLDRPAHHAAELLQLHWRHRLGSGVEEVAGVPGAVAAKRVSRAVKGIGPRPDSHVHYGPGLPAVLRFGIFLEVEFLDGVDGQDHRRIGKRTRHIGDRAGIAEIGIDNAVQHPGGFIGPKVVGALGPGRAARLDHHTWTQIQQVLVIAAIQRHIVDVRVAEGAAQRGARRIHQWDGFVDRDGLALRAGLYGQVDSDLLADLEHNILTCQRLETRKLDADRVRAGNQSGRVI